jgi:hypothetical protein
MKTNARRWWSVVGLMGLAAGLALGQEGAGPSAWQAWVAEEPGVVDDARVSEAERLVLAVLTPEQAALYRQGVPAAELVLADGRTLAAYLAARAVAPPSLYVGLGAACAVAADEWWGAGEERAVAVREPCAIPAAAVAVLLDAQARTADGPRLRVKVWAGDLPEPAAPVLAGGDRAGPTQWRTTTVVPLCAAADCAAGDLRVRSSAAAQVTGRVLGYFRPAAGADAADAERLGDGTGAAPGRSPLFVESADNNFFGTGAGANTTGFGNAFFGAYAGRSNTEGSGNNFFGAYAGYLNTTGYANAFFGYTAGYRNTTGYANAFFGASAGANTESSGNAFFGAYAGESNTRGYNNAFFGYEAGRANTGGWDNAFFGSLAGRANTTGFGNAFFGSLAGSANTTGSGNASFGDRAGRANTTGSGNASFGILAGSANTEGDHNAFFGSFAGQHNTTGSGNASFGYGAGGSNTIEKNNSFIGSLADGVAGITNATALGHRAQVSQSNSLVLGSIAGQNGATTSVNVGIGLPNPQRQLHLRGPNATFRMDRSADTAAFLLVRTNTAGTALKTFVVGANAAGPNNGQFIINDLGTAVGGDGVRRLTIGNTGHIGLGNILTPAHPVHHANGAYLSAGGVWTNGSSRALKEGIHALTAAEARETLAGLAPVRYRYTAEPGKAYLGFIAEDVPDAVATADRKGLSPMDIVAVLTKVVQEQQAELAAQQKTAQEQQARVARLETRLAEFETLEVRLNQLEGLLLEQEPQMAAMPKP